MRLTEIQLPTDRAAIVELIQRDCQPFLGKIGGKMGEYTLHRGMAHSRTPLVKKQVRLDDRNALSTSAVKHERYNNYFEDEFGVPFRNALFASGNKDQAAFYGDVFTVFPIGEFDWLWSPNIEDLALDITWPRVGGFDNVPPSQEHVDSELSRAGYDMNSNIKGAIESGNEIMIRCKEYYASSIHVWNDL